MRRPRGKPRSPAKDQKAAAIAYATRICQALSPVLKKLRDAIDLKNYELEQRSSIARETIAQIVKGTHGASLFVLAAVSYVLAGGLPALARDLDRGQKKPR